MPVRFRANRGRRRLAPRARLVLELLESRYLLSGNSLSGLLAPVSETEDNDTLDRAQLLGELTSRAAVQGTIGNGTAGAGDVDWYRFLLTRPASILLSAAPQTGQPGPVLSLYNNDPSDSADTYDPLGHRLLAQAEATSSGPATLASVVAAGTYFVAVSGAGNRDFHPFLADSGYPGRRGDYRLDLSVGDLGLASGSGPVVLSATPDENQPLDHSPLVVRLSLSADLDPTTVLSGQTVRLTFNPTGNFGTSADKAVTLSKVNYAAQVDEIQLFPAAALAPGFYRVRLSGDNSTGAKVIKDRNGVPLGGGAGSPGQDFTLTFRVSGIEGDIGPLPAADDTPGKAHSLGDLTGAGLVQVTGAIGDDPAYDPRSRNRLLANRSADVDLYHFQLEGEGRFALTAEVFAGRIGSPLDPGLSLFQADETGKLQLLAANNNTQNDSTATNLTVPLFTDPVLYAGLAAGDYYLAVSANGNVPAAGSQPGVNGLFNPNVSHSGFRGSTTGDYVLNLKAEADNEAPRVTQVTLAEGADLAAPPTSFTVRFSEPVNLRQLATSSFEISSTTELEAVFVRGSDGIDYHPRLVSYDDTSYRADFLMLDALPNGPAALHLSGAGPFGLTDLAGNLLVGTPDSAGDYVVHFSVDGPARGSDGDPLHWLVGDLNSPVLQDLGVLFPHELQAGVVVERTSSPGKVDTGDLVAFEVLQTRDYFLNLDGTAGVSFALFDAAGNEVTGTPQGDTGNAFQFSLDAGKYLVRVEGWSADQASDVQYQLTIVLADSPDNPPPLTLGPAPAIRLRLPEDPSAPVLPGAPSPSFSSPGEVASAAGVAGAEANPGPLLAMSGPVLPGSAEADVAPSILLTRLTDTAGVRAEDDRTMGIVPEDAISAGDQVLPFEPSPLLVSTFAIAYVEGDTALLAEGDGAQTAPGPNENVASNPRQEPVLPPARPASPTLAKPTVSVKGMPGKVALDALFEMESLQASLSGMSVGSKSLAAGVSEMDLAGFPSTPAHEPATQTRWIDLLTVASACASLALGGWCTARLWRRRAAGAERRISWEDEGSSEYRS